MQWLQWKFLGYRKKKKVNKSQKYQIILPFYDLFTLGTVSSQSKSPQKVI